jgi:hypothetical protein
VYADFRVTIYSNRAKRLYSAGRAEWPPGTLLGWGGPGDRGAFAELRKPSQLRTCFSLMANFPPTSQSSREVGFVFTIAIIIGLVVGTGLTVLLAPRAESFEACVAREMKRQPHVDLLNAQRICTQGHGIRRGW